MAETTEVGAYHLRRLSQVCLRDIGLHAVDGSHAVDRAN